MKAVAALGPYLPLLPPPYGAFLGFLTYIFPYGTREQQGQEPLLVQELFSGWEQESLLLNPSLSSLLASLLGWGS